MPLTETQAETANDLSCYISLEMADILAKRLSKKQADKLEREIRTCISRGAEQCARDLLKLPRSKREEMMKKLAEHDS